MMMNHILFFLFYTQIPDSGYWPYIHFPASRASLPSRARSSERDEQSQWRRDSSTRNHQTGKPPRSGPPNMWLSPLTELCPTSLPTVLTWTKLVARPSSCGQPQWNFTLVITVLVTTSTSKSSLWTSRGGSLLARTLVREVNGFSRSNRRSNQVCRWEKETNLDKCYEGTNIITSAVKRSIGSTTGCKIMEKAPTRAFYWLKVPTSAFTFKTLLRLYAKWALTHSK